ncbi:MAG: hypothetical protein Kow0010_11250 [Dehalococcoidia bacterium]
MPTHHPPEDVWRHLTIAQVEVLACLARGLTQREAAEALGITPGSVRSTVATLRRLTGFRRGADMGAWWEGFAERYVLQVARAAGARFGA